MPGTPNLGLRCLVTGAGGFIGHNLVNRLKALGYWVRGVDIKRPEFEATKADEFLLVDLRERYNAEIAVDNVDIVFGLAADMGGMGFIGSHAPEILRHNLLINVNTLHAARQAGVKRYFYPSSACVYPDGRQASATAAPLREDEAYPADPDTDYGWEKLTTERFARANSNTDGWGAVRIARFHNVYGPLGTWRGGREKVPAAICRKIATAKLRGETEIEIWGDGEQTRSFLYIDDCIDGILALVAGEYTQPVNIGSTHAVSINGLARLIAAIAGVPITLRHVEGPQGVRGRNADITLAQMMLGWQPRVGLDSGMATTYQWIEDQVRKALADGTL